LLDLESDEEELGKAADSDADKAAVPPATPNPTTTNLFVLSVSVGSDKEKSALEPELGELNGEEENEAQTR